MSREVRRFSVSVPAGTLSTAPQVTNLTMPPRIARRVIIRFPPGPQGTLGAQLSMSGRQVVPINAGEWLIGDNESLPFDLEGYPDSGAWQLTAYNTGTYAHSVYLTFELDPPQLAGQAVGGAPLVIAPGGA